MYKIAHIVLGKANPNRMNGVNKVVNVLATTQQKLGYDVEVIGLSNSKENDTVQRSYKLKIFNKQKYTLSKELIYYLNHIDSKTIFHIHGGFIFDFYLISKILKRNNLKYIFTSHGSYNKEALKKNFFIKTIYFKLFEKIILKNAWKVQFLGKSEFEHIDNLTNTINKVLIPNGQTQNELNFKYKKINLNDTLVFGFVGRIDKYTKGLDLLLNGFLEYVKNSGEGSLWIVGDGKDLENLKFFTQENKIDNRVTFFGSKFGEEKLNIIANMDVFVHTSRNEGFPMAVLEALALNIPVLVSKETNIGDYIKKYNTGIVLDLNTSKNISKAFTELTSKNIKIIKKNIVDMMKKEFNWETIIKELLFD